MLKSKLKNEWMALTLTAWLMSKYGPNCWVTKRGGIGWVGDNPELEKEVDRIFEAQRDDI